MPMLSVPRPKRRASCCKSACCLVMFACSAGIRRSTVEILLRESSGISRCNIFGKNTANSASAAETMRSCSTVLVAFSPNGRRLAKICDILPERAATSPCSSRCPPVSFIPSILYLIESQRYCKFRNSRTAGSHWSKCRHWLLRCHAMCREICHTVGHQLIPALLPKEGRENRSTSECRQNFLISLTSYDFGMPSIAL